MTNPQPDHLRQPPKRAEPWQPDRPGDADMGRSEDATPDADQRPAVPPTSPSVAPEGSAAHRLSHPGGARQDVRKAVRTATSAESAVPRDPQTGQALDDPSLTSGKDSDRSDGRAGSMHLPES